MEKHFVFNEKELPCLCINPSPRGFLWDNMKNMQIIIQTNVEGC